MKEINYRIIIIIIVALITTFMSYLWFNNYQSSHSIITNQQSSNVVSNSSSVNTNVSEKVAASPLYQAKQFDITIKGLSKKQISEHEELYKGYAKQRNNITKALKTADRSQPNRTYSPFRELKIEESYAINGQILHELYFENLSNNATTPGKEMLTLIKNDFGSLDNFKKDFFDCALVSRGWVVAAYSFDDHRLHNFVFEEHHHNIPVLMFPLLVLDVYEHAYMIDYGIARNPYIDVFWNHINWNVVEQRIEKWVNKLK